jgi:C4-dicarboxylate-specific signal transduction histidine kinase
VETGNPAEAMGSMKRRELVVTTKLVDAESVEVAVADRGPGLPKVMADELFVPALLGPIRSR